jgi:hypothetical protein
VSETTKYVLFCFDFFLVIFLSPDNGAEKWLASASRLPHASQKSRQHNTATAARSSYLRITEPPTFKFPTGV